MTRITWQYYDRYRLPVMHTETNIARGTERRRGRLLALEGMGERAARYEMTEYPMVGFTWYSLTDQVDWDTALREDNGHVNPLGLYDLDRNIRPVGREYKKLIQEWGQVLPTQSVCLQVPVVPPNQHDAEWARTTRQQARLRRRAAPTEPYVADGATTSGGLRGLAER